MTMSKKLDRRNFLRLSAVTVGSVVLASCAQEETPTEAPAEEAPVEEEVVEEATATPRVMEEATATPVEQAVAANQAPVLQELVEAGTLPPLEERIPVVPLTLAPVNTIGNYGGRFKMAHWWHQGGVDAGSYGHSPLRWVDDGLGIAPGQCESYESNDDASVWTLHFREGMKWSDGAPLTTADVMYWWNDMVLDPDQSTQVPSEFPAMDGIIPVFEAVDDYTLTITFPKPSPLTGKRLAMWSNGMTGYNWIVPAHYAKQFNPKYNDEYTDYEEHDRQIDYRITPECPSCEPWICTEYTEGEFSTWERNPYYYAVDTEGNQLPYVDGWDVQASPDSQYFITQVTQGSVSWEVYTYQLTLGDVAVLKESEEAGNYEVRFWDTGSGTGSMWFWNHDVQDPVRRALYRDPKFKGAMSLAIDRESMKRILYYDTGTPTTGTMSPKAFEFNFNAEAQAHYEKFRTLYVDYDPETAKAMLDEIGCTVGADGFRTFPDGSEFIFNIDAAADISGEHLQAMEMCQQYWTDIGLNVVINSIPPAEFGPAWRAGQLEFRGNWEVGDGPDHLLYPSWVVPDESERWSPLTGALRLNAGTEVDGTELDLTPWDRTPARYDASDPEYAETNMPTLHALYDQAVLEPDEIKRMELVWQMNEIHMTDGPFFLGTVCNTPRIIIVSKDLDNVPTRDQLRMGGFCNPWIIPYPAITNPETYSFKNV